MTSVTRRELLGDLLRKVTERARRFSPMDGGKPTRLIAEVISEVCVGTGGGGCRACLSCCPVGEDVIVWAEGPKIDAARCNGCGICENICRTMNSPGAILIRPRLPGDQGAREEPRWQ